MDNEMLESTAETTGEAEVTTEAELAAFDEGWDDTGVQSESAEEAEQETEETAEADQQEAKDAGALQDNAPAEEQKDEKAEEKNTDEADQRMTVKHLDEIRELDWKRDKDEIKTLVQKGMDYDRKNQKLTDLESFLKELAEPQKLTVEQLMDVTRARIYARNEAKEGRTISDSEALLAVQKQRAEKAEQQKTSEESAKKAEKETEKQRTQDMITRFISAYPDVKGDDIPKDVWDESAKSGDLVAAYAKYERKQLQERIAVLEQNKKNTERSIGSVRSTGAAKTPDAFDEGWNID